MSNGTYGNKNITLQGNKIGLEDNRPWYEKAGMYFLPGNENDSNADQERENDLDLPEFEWGMNVPSFQLAEKGLGTLGNLGKLWLGFQQFEQNKKLADKQIAMADMTYKDNRRDKETAAKFASDRYNTFLRGYAGENWKDNYAPMPTLPTSSAIG